MFDVAKVQPIGFHAKFFVLIIANEVLQIVNALRSKPVAGWQRERAAPHADVAPLLMVGVVGYAACSLALASASLYLRLM
jgi:hypothetical protein